MFFSKGKKAERRAVFEEQMLEHLDALYGTALRMTADRATAEDLVQDTYLRALRFRHKFEPGTNLRAWMFRMMVNLHINKCRRERRGRQIHEGLERHDMAERVLPSEKMAPTRRPEEYFFERMMSDDVARALDALPRDFKMVVLLADINGFRYSQIAEILNIPVGTVMSRLHRGRRLLRESLHAFAIEEGYIKPTEGETADLEAFRRSKQDREVG